MMRTGLRDCVLGVLLLCGVAACTWTGMRSDTALAKRVYIAGALEYGSTDRVAATVAPFLGVPFFDVDIDGIARQLQTLPWLANVSVDRHWPDGVVVRVTDHRPIAHWNDQQLLTADFSVITPPAGAQLPMLPHLYGPAQTGRRVYTRFRDMNNQLAVAGDRRLMTLKLDARGSWEATLADGLQLRFGRDHLMLRLQRFINYALNRMPGALAQAGYVDLRYTDGFAVGGTRKAAALEKRNEQKA